MQQQQRVKSIACSDLRLEWHLVRKVRAESIVSMNTHPQFGVRVCAMGVDDQFHINCIDCQTVYIP